MNCREIGPQATLRTCAETIYFPHVCETTRSKVRSELNRWERFTGDPPVSEITKQTLVGFHLALLGAGYAQDTAVTNIAYVRTILAECEDWGLIEAVPSVGRRKMRRTRTEPQGATVEQVDAIYRHAGAVTWPRVPVGPALFWRSWIAIVSWTGLRLGDSLSTLRWEHWKRDERLILIVASKTRRYGKRHVFVVPDWLEWHLRIMERCESERVFPCPASTLTRFRSHLYAICAAAGVPRVSPQNLRQFSITQWSAASQTAGSFIHGCGLPSVMHKYVHVARTLERAAPDVVMPKAFCGW